MPETQTIAPAIPVEKQRHAMTSTPELLAPAGDWACAKAAVENGADAIYFGLERFNARMRAHNFTEADLPELMAFLHERGVKGYVTFNTLVFSHEIAQAEQYLKTIISAGVDAAIVQDPGVCRIIRRLSPDFPIHASTQMTITSRAGVEFARRLGCHLVVLARECSIQEIEKIRTSSVSPQPGYASLPLEVFVHGALCVAYSGQCLTSESLGGRSANRGECAQACRMPYELISDGKTITLGDRRYLLSPQDLAGLKLIPELCRAGVSSFKIEGRLKTPEYVASITRVYRQAIDEAATQAAPVIPQQDTITPKAGAQYDMEMAFSRGLYTGWLEGNDNQKLVHARFGKKRGVLVGEVTRVQSDRITLSLQNSLKPGDGVVFDAGKPDQPEEGGRVYEVTPTQPKTAGDNEVIVAFGHGDIDSSRIKPGQKIWKTNDPELDRRIRQTFAGDSPRHQRPVTMEVTGREGKPLLLITRDQNGRSVRVQSSQVLEKAHRRPLATQKLEEQLGRLGGTPFTLTQLTNRLEGDVILPVSELNRLRREAIGQLIEHRRHPQRWTLVETPVNFSTPKEEQGTEPAEEDINDQPAKLIPLVRNMGQLQAALEWDPSWVYCEFEDPKKYRDAVTLFRKVTSPPKNPDSHSSPKIYVAPPRIFKMGEEWILRQVQSSQPDGYLIRNYDQMEFFKDAPGIGDFSLNVANEWTAEWFVKQCGLPIVTASYDLNMSQLEALLRAAPARWFEITIHQHMPMFHMEHCVFCAFLSKGKDYRDCGRPCDVHQVKLRDRVGAEHPLKADAGCRNTVFNAQAQTGAEFVPHMMDLGVRRFRIEFLNESPQEVKSTLDRYQALLQGTMTGDDLWRELKLLNQLGVTRGQMDRADRFS